MLGLYAGKTVTLSSRVKMCRILDRARGGISTAQKSIHFGPFHQTPEGSKMNTIVQKKVTYMPEGKQQTANTFAGLRDIATLLH